VPAGSTMHFPNFRSLLELGHCSIRASPSFVCVSPRTRKWFFFYGVYICFWGCPHEPDAFCVFHEKIQYSKQISVHYKHPKKVQSTYLLHLNILKSACIAMHENTKNSLTLSLKETKCLVCNICWCRIVRVEVVVLLCFRREVSMLS
jgi:hypothetical protein